MKEPMSNNGDVPKKVEDPKLEDVSLQNVYLALAKLLIAVGPVDATMVVPDVESGKITIME